MKSVKELYDTYFSDIFYDGIWEISHEFDNNDIIEILKLNKEEFVPEIVNTLYEVLKNQQQKLQKEEEEDNIPILVEHLKNYIKNYNNDNNLNLNNPAIAKVLILCAKDYL